MKKRIFSLLLCIAMLLTLLPQTVLFASAATSGTCGTNLTWNYNSSTYTLTITGSGAMPNWGFSSSVPWYSYSSSIRSVSLSDGLTSIGSYAFSGCTGLTEVHISDIAAWCGISFDDYSANPLYYAKKLYLNDTLITDLVIPSGVTSIGKYAFVGCTGLTSITLPDSVTSIGNDAFEYCTELTSISIPDSVTSIGDGAFDGCSGLTAISIPDSVTSIGDFAFYDCTGLTSISIPDSVTSIGDFAFYDCTGLTSITIPSGVTSIGELAFSGCTGLSHIHFLGSKPSIGPSAFSYCASDLTLCYLPGTTGWENYITYPAEEWDCTATPNCTSITYTCNTCGEAYTVIGEYHDWSLTETITAPTCTEAGSIEYTCAACGTTKTEPIPATGHNYVDGVCTVCGYVKPAFTKITDAADLEDGKYLIVCEECNVALNAGLEKVDAGHNVIDVVIAEGTIEADDTTTAAVVEIASMEGGYSLMAGNGKYLYGTADRNALNEETDPVANTITFKEGNAIITAGRQLQFNKASGDTNFRFRYYTAGNQTAVQLYKLDEDPDSCTHANTEIRDAVAATCTAPGKAAGIFCFDCGTYISGGETVEALGHVDENGDDQCDRCGGGMYDPAEAPSIVSVLPTHYSATGTQTQPEISVQFVNAGKTASVEMILDGEAVSPTVTEGQAVYTPVTALENGKHDVSVCITRQDGMTAQRQWSFYVGEHGASLYFGQLHSHTAEYSDGAGMLEQAYEHAYAADDMDFLIVTDHSNYFDTSARNSTASYYDLSTLAESAGGTTKWEEARATAEAYNEMYGGEMVCAYGYEMTWSGGPGHMNTFNTYGTVSRNNSSLNNKTGYAGMLRYYDLMVSANQGKDIYGTTGVRTKYLDAAPVISQFNHPGTTFGNFGDFTGYTADRDEVICLLEVGNGSGKVGASGYYPSYEEYDLALSMGWHIAPTNNQDNHNGNWGDANTCRDVVLADALTEEDLYTALSDRRCYSTEDQNLEIRYSLTTDGMDYLMGDIAAHGGTSVTLNYQINDPDAGDVISTVYIIGENGRTVASKSYTGNSCTDAVTVSNTEAYYYLKLVQKDGQIAVTAPVWVGAGLGCDHDWSVSEVVSATCTDGGYTVYTCANCGETKTEAVAALGHNYVDGVCTVCGGEKSDSSEVVIYYPYTGKVVTTESYIYSNYSTGATKYELLIANASLVDGEVECSTENVARFTLLDNGDGTVTFRTSDGRYLYADGTDVKLVSSQSDYTKYVLEEADGGVYIRCATATYTDETGTFTQYLEVYSGYFTVYGINTSYAHLYTFGLYPVAAPCTHDWGEGVQTKEATCTDAGETTYTCSLCNKTRTEEIAALGHIDEDADNKCDRCGKDLSAKEGFNKITSTSELTAGKYLIVCEECNVALNAGLEKVDAGNNVINVTIADGTIEADDTTTAAVVEIASMEGGYSIKAGNGKYLYGTSGKNALNEGADPVANTITFDGGNAIITFADHALQFNKASGDTNFRFRYYPAGGQTAVQLYKLNEGPASCAHRQTEIRDAIAATCVEPGFTGDTYCVDCGAKLAEGEEIPALDHDITEVTVVPITCTSEGALYLSCSRCDYSEYQFVAALGHNYVWTETDPTCTEEGFTGYVCTLCGDRITESTTEALGHIYQESFVLAPTCTVKGIVKHTCERCGDYYTEIVPALGHDMITSFVAPTCVDSGYTQHICSHCDFVQREDYVDPLGHDTLYTDNGDDHTVTCTRCDYSVTEAHTYTNGFCVCGSREKKLSIVSASLRLNEDLNMIYAVELPIGATDPYMVFHFTDNEYTVREYTRNSAGQYCFELQNINPQCMGNNISATLYAAKDGKTVSATKSEYSVREYCINQLIKTDDPLLKTLLSDILTYGAAAQVYMDYKIYSPVNAGLSLTPSTFTELSGLAATFTGEQDDTTCWTGAALVLSNDLATRFTFVTDSTEGLTVEVSINGRTETFDTFEDAGDGKYYITFDGIQATEFDDTVTAKFYRNGEQIGAAVNYSVNTYICNTQNSDSADLQALVRALYNYGASAKAYANK